MHCIGTLAGWATMGAALVLRKWWWIAVALLIPYAFAWISHFFIEHNKPASFGHPLWSWWADQRMVALSLVGKMEEELKKCEAAQSWTSETGMEDVRM